LKIAAWQFWYCGDFFKDCGPTMGDCQPFVKLRHSNRDHTGHLRNCGAAINGLHQPLENLRHSNRKIMPASWKIVAQQLVDSAGLLKIQKFAVAALQQSANAEMA
jgi:hypothetical protein